MIVICVVSLLQFNMYNIIMKKYNYSNIMICKPECTPTCTLSHADTHCFKSISLVYK